MELRWITAETLTAGYVRVAQNMSFLTNQRSTGSSMCVLDPNGADLLCRSCRRSYFTGGGKGVQLMGVPAERMLNRVDQGNLFVISNFGKI